MRGQAKHGIRGSNAKTKQQNTHLGAAVSEFLRILCGINLFDLKLCH